MIIPNLKRHAAMTLVGLLYGANYGIVKIATPAFIPPFGFIVFRVVIATAVFWLLSIGTSDKINWKKDGSRLALCAFFGVGINMLFFFKGLSMTSAINASIIMTLTPILVFLVSLFLLKERFTGQKFIGLILGLAGALIIVYHPGVDNGASSWVGDLLILLNASSYGVYLVLAKPLLQKYNPITITKWVFLLGNVIVLPVGWNEAMHVDWQTFTPAVYMSMAYVIIGVTVIAYFTNIWAMKKVNPSTVGVYIYLQPVFATLLANVFFDERLTVPHLIAALLVFGGVGLVIKN